MLGLSTSCVPPLAMAVPAGASPQASLAASRATRTGGLFLRAVPLYPAPAAGAGFADIAAAPFVPPAQDTENADRARDCLTAAIYYEARSQATDGQRAVAQVVLNRVRSPAFPG
ncbi:MAG TPA: cell wall hydrolase, partial [Sphingomonas sp.]